MTTRCSDGLLTPRELVAAANAGGLDVIAVTDHDTAAGIEPARAAAREAGGPRVFAGAELTCSLDGEEVHLLGYGIDPTHPAIAAFAARGADLRRERLAAMVARLNALGVRLRVEDVEVEPDCRSIGRPHLARSGHVDILARPEQKRAEDAANGLRKAARGILRARRQFAVAAIPRVFTPDRVRGQKMDRNHCQRR